jgi:hypothetical protein
MRASSSLISLLCLPLFCCLAVAVPPDADSVMQRLGKLRLGKLAMGPACPREKLRGALEKVTVEAGEASLSEGQKAQLLDDAAMLLSLLFCQDSPQPYRQWREARGAKPIPKEEMIDDWLVPYAYGLYTGGKELPEGLTATELFDLMWRESRAHEAIATRVDAIAIEPAGLAIALHEATAEHPDWPQVQAEPLGDVWSLRASGGSRRWFRPDPEAEALIERGEKVLLADLALVVEFEDAVRRPIHTRWFHHEGAKHWKLQHMHITFPYGDISAIIEY